MVAKDERSLKIAMSGATGFVGTNLGKAFQARGWKIVPLGRKDFMAAPEILADRLQGADVVVNLAGAPIIGRWTREYKQIIYDSRIDVTGKIVSACSLMDRSPELLISTSAVGYYSSQGVHTEAEHVKADDFLGRLTGDWEKEALKAGNIGMRVVIFRFGIVLGKGGGALQQMLIPFQYGLGGTIGDGAQPVSWVHMDDLTRAFQTAIEEVTYKGIYNLTAPHPTTNKGLTAVLGKALHRPVFFRVPEFALRLRFGEGARVLTSGQAVIPRRLLDSGFKFQFTEINEAVLDCLSD